MTTPRCIALLLVTGLATGCSTSGAPVPVPGPTVAPPTPEQQAVAAYERYWSVSQDAFSAPSARDWRQELEGVASGPALESVVRDVLNYADFPAHTEGAVTRAPIVAAATDTLVEIVDCVNLGDSRLVADRTGEVLDDLVNRVQRYTFRAQVVTSGDRWLVNRTDPAQDEPC